MSLSNAYFEGRAEGILDTVQIMNPAVTKEEFRFLYYQTLKKLGYDEEKSMYWVRFYFDKKG